MKRNPESFEPQLRLTREPSEAEARAAEHLDADIQHVEIVNPGVAHVKFAEKENIAERGRLSRAGHALIEAAKNNVSQNIFHP